MSNKQKPLASVVIPTFNRANLLPETLSSIVAQDYRPLEILIIDDGSTDNTEEIVSSFPYEDVNIIYKKIPASGGPSTPRNIGIEEARGECIFLFDSDDIMLPGKISQSVAAYLQGRKHKIGLYFTDFFRASAHGEPEGDSLLKSYSLFQEARKIHVDSHLFLIDSETAYTTLCAENYIGTSGVMIPREILKESRYRFDSELQNSEDRDLWFKITRKHPIGYIDAPGHCYRTHRNSITSGEPIKHATNKIRVLEQQLTFEPNCTQRKYLQERINANRLSMAYSYECNEQFKTARKIYWGLLRYSFNKITVRRILTTFVKQLLISRRVASPDQNIQGSGSHNSIL